jgi:hypothetical protein
MAMNRTHANPFGNLDPNCVACGRDPGLRYWHFEDNRLCWSCWQRVERLAHKPADVIVACRAFRSGDGDLVSGAEHDDLVALGFLVE